MQNERDSSLQQQFSPRLSFLEGLRGIAAFIVMAGHAMGMVVNGIVTEIGTDFQGASPLLRLLWPFFFGTQMVWLFIFVSGFSLYYSEARRRMTDAKTSLKVYVWRRAWRILPTYYAAIFISLLMIALLPGMKTQPEASIFHVYPITVGGIVSHLFLVHNLNTEWISQINAPLWSIATEAQLYLIFPLILTAMMRFNPYVVAASCIGLQLATQHFLPFPFFAQTIFFVSGMLLAHVVIKGRFTHFRAALAIGILALIVGIWRGPRNYGLPSQLLFLVGYSGLLIALCHMKPAWWNLTTWKPIRTVGKWSYSLYAMHYPLVFLLFSMIKDYAWPPHVKVILMLVAGSAISLAAAWLSYTTIERWSLKLVDYKRATHESPLLPTAAQS